MSNENFVNGKIRTVIGIVFGDNTLSTSSTNKYTINSSLTADYKNGHGLTFTESEIDEALTWLVSKRINQ